MSYSEAYDRFIASMKIDDMNGMTARLMILRRSTRFRPTSGPNWRHRSILTRFSKPDRQQRRQAFDELCEMLGVDGSQVTCS